MNQEIQRLRITDLPDHCGLAEPLSAAGIVFVDQVFTTPKATLLCIPGVSPERLSALGDSLATQLHDRVDASIPTNAQVSDFGSAPSMREQIPRSTYEQTSPIPSMERAEHEEPIHPHGGNIVEVPGTAIENPSDEFDRHHTKPYEIFDDYIHDVAPTDAQAQVSSTTTLVLRPSWRSFYYEWAIVIAIPLLWIFGPSLADRIGLNWTGMNEKVIELLTILGALTIVSAAAMMGYKRLVDRFHIDESGVAHHRGIIAKSTSQLEYRHITSMAVHQSVMDRLVGILTASEIGSAEFASSATAGVEVRFTGILDPNALKDMASKLGRSPSARPTEHHSS